MSHAKINTIHINMHLATLSLTGRMACCHKIKRIYFYWTIMFSTHGLPHISISSAILNIMIQFQKCYWIIDGQHNMEEFTPQITKFMGPTCWPHEPCYQEFFSKLCSCWWLSTARCQSICRKTGMTKCGSCIYMITTWSGQDGSMSDESW